ncbi:30S ribosomal protein S3 [Methanonatronarchaeum sp. AMET6-2]|uniref:30S ribosomal protein S3 n=1 Tax=Methanonatronarchaeum sp. AMET6-2 TaxID=2933293 RepID=UPI0011F6D736|nr:30S ribosomal protein S3 [Methanonatronarchaeum sp. AMET6-2]RZN60213.1 MAG: 30S ribosomal protein S3 [Methanonatronarchaeia archaeon]UOY10707.1 30S ribosomal protein S3 [Methanonatronarchaeum sp. AMET6-2]
MAIQKKFVKDGIKKAEMDEFLSKEIDRGGYGGIDVNRTPTGTQIVLYAEKPGMIIGKGGKRIRKLTRKFKEKFDLEDPSIEVKEVGNPNTNAQVVAQRLANALERGWYFRRAGYSTLRDIMDAGAMGGQIVLSGKLTGSRSRVEKFTEGYVKHCGQPAQEIVDEGQAVAKKKLGTIGVTVRIIQEGATLPDEVEVVEPGEIDEEEIELTAETEEKQETEEKPEEEPEKEKKPEPEKEPEEKNDRVVCQVCGEDFKAITGSHLATHDIDMDEYKEKYPDANITPGE